MDPRSIALRPQTLALLVAALFLSALTFRLIPEPPERDVLGRENAIAHLREMLARMPTDDTVAVRPWRQVSLDEEVQYMNRSEADRAAADSMDLARRSCPSEREDYFGWDQCRDQYARRVFDRADAQGEIAQLQGEISSGRAKTWGFGVVGLFLALGACWLAARLGRDMPPVAVDLARGEAPGDALAREQGLLVTCHIAAWTVALMLLVWSQVFVGWLGLLEGRGLTYEQLSGRLDASGMGWRFAITVVPSHLFVLGVMRRVIVALRLKIAEFQATDPELSVPAQFKAWTTSSAARAVNRQQQLGENRALADALHTNGANPDDIARVVAEIRAMEGQAAQAPPPVEQSLQEVLGALARKRAELGVLRRNGAPEAAVAAASAAVAELRGRLVELGASLSTPA